MDLGHSTQLLFQKLLSMGCQLGCLKPTVIVEGVRYKVIRQIAEGGFSTVNLVENLETGKKYALKKITCHSIEDQNVALKEIEINRSFSHPNIIHVVASSTEGKADILHGVTSEVFIVFPLYKQSLQDDLERRQMTNNPLSIGDLLRVFFQICSAVKELHNADPPIAHRDIKPHNIMLERDLSPVLMDFGSATTARVDVSTLKEAAYLQDTAAERCSMTFRPPELFHVAAGVPLDERTDIWSLGCLLYALMYFKGPFENVYERGDSVALAVQSGKIDLPDVNDPIKQHLQDLIISMTNLDINFRINIDSVISRISELQDLYQNKV